MWNFVFKGFLIYIMCLLSITSFSPAVLAYLLQVEVKMKIAEYLSKEVTMMTTTMMMKERMTMKVKMTKETITQDGIV